MESSGRIKAEKTEEFADYIKQVKALIATYVPPDSAKMQAAHEAGNVSLIAPGDGTGGHRVPQLFAAGRFDDPRHLGADPQALGH